MPGIQQLLARSLIRKGDELRHIEYGNCTVVKVARDGTVTVRLDDDGIEGTVSADALRKRPTTP